VLVVARRTKRVACPPVQSVQTLESLELVYDEDGSKRRTLMHGLEPRAVVAGRCVNILLLESHCAGDDRLGHPELPGRFDLTVAGFNEPDDPDLCPQVVPCALWGHSDNLVAHHVSRCHIHSLH
jgi:hypothetical protein